MENFLLNTFNTKTDAEKEALGSVSDKLRVAGCVPATVKSMIITIAESWSKVDIEFATDNGTASISEFNSTPKDESAEAVDKANAANTRLQNSIARLLKKIGIKDMAAASVGSVEGLDGKGRPTLRFPKVEGKKLHITTYTEIQADKTGAKAYANQVVDTFKYLNKAGNNDMGINSVELFDTDAKSRMEIYFKDDKNPVCIAKLASLKEKQDQAVAQAVAQTVAPAGTTNGMPVGTVTAEDTEI